MKKLLFLIILPLHLISATLIINTARDDDKTISILHLIDNEKISCEEVLDEDFQDKIICHLSKPVKNSKPIENRFFKLHYYKNNVVITPKFKMNLYALQGDLIENNEIVQYSEKKKRLHWVVIGYEKEPISFHKSSEDGLNFAIDFQKKDFPFIEELDLNGNPAKNISHAEIMSRLKQFYKEKKFDMALNECDRIFKNENSTFFNEALLYKMRIFYDQLSGERGMEKIDPYELIDMANEWISTNPSNIHIPEVLLFLSKSYLSLGQNLKAQKYLDLLTEVYPDNRFTHLAQIIHADKLSNSGQQKMAIKIYKKVLYSTKDRYVAAIAALRLSRTYLTSSDVNEAKRFFDKVMGGNRDFIKNNLKNSFRFAKKFADNNETQLAIDIGNIIKKTPNDGSLDEDEFSKEMAVWQEKIGNKEKALELYYQYLDKYHAGSYNAFVQTRIDRLLIDSNESNNTKRLAQLDNIMAKYKGQHIYKKALLQKAQILLEEKRYQDILDIGDILKKYGGDILLKEVASIVAKKSLKNGDCAKSMSMLDDYNISMESMNQEQIFDCLMRINNYPKALKLANKFAKSENLEETLRWSYEIVKLFSKMGKYEDLILLSKDVEKMANIMKLSSLSDDRTYDDVIYDRIFAFFNVDAPFDLILDDVVTIEKKFPNNPKNLDVYDRILREAKKRKDDLIVINYAKKIIDLQKKYKLDLFTPKVELDYIEGLKRLGKFREALKLDLDLLYKKMSDKQKAHVLYLAGELSQRINKIEESKSFFLKCGEIIEDSAWRKLCVENLKLLEE